tara:strand:+ start:545 stop:1006 length:462 start_codon:yes stop_codon:yes gene_type:complete
VKHLLTEWRKYLKEESYITPGQEYVGLILDDDSAKLLQSKMPSIPQGWTPGMHHMTIKFGREGVPSRYKGRNKVKVVGLAQDDKAWAVRVETDVPTKNDVPHITIATAPGIKPNESNEFSIEDFKPIAPFDLEGEVKEKYSDQLQKKRPQIKK